MVFQFLKKSPSVAIFVFGFRIWYDVLQTAESHSLSSNKMGIEKQSAIDVPKKTAHSHQTDKPNGNACSNLDIVRKNERHSKAKDRQDALAMLDEMDCHHDRQPIGRDERKTDTGASSLQEKPKEPLDNQEIAKLQQFFVCSSLSASVRFLNNWASVWISIPNQSLYLPKDSIKDVSISKLEANGIFRKAELTVTKKDWTVEKFIIRSADTHRNDTHYADASRDEGNVRIEKTDVSGHTLQKIENGTSKLLDAKKMDISDLQKISDLFSKHGMSISNGKFKFPQSNWFDLVPGGEGKLYRFDVVKWVDNGNQTFMKVRSIDVAGVVREMTVTSDRYKTGYGNPNAVAMNFPGGWNYQGR